VNGVTDENERLVAGKPAKAILTIRVQTQSAT
jgi:hypothetical protein